MGWFAFDIEAYDADTMHLTAAEDGVYSRLLRHYYRTRMPLPDDDRALAGIARIALAEWAPMAGTIRAFFQGVGGRLRPKRCDTELNQEDDLASVRSDHARRAAEKRWALNRHAGSMPGASTEHPDAVLATCLQDAPDILKHATRPDQTSKKTTSAKSVAESFEPWWSHYPRKLARGAAERAYIRALTKTSPETLLAAVQRFASQCAGKDPQYVPHAATWLNAERWSDEAPKPNGNGHAQPGETPWDARVSGFRRIGFWLALWGPKPNEPGCQAPKEFLE